MTTEGEIAARVAHRINNPLTAVIANLDVALAELASLARELETCAAIEERLRDARDAAERMHRAIRDLTRGVPVATWAPPPPAPIGLAEASGPVRRGRVLVVDDEQLIANALSRTLALDHEVTTLAGARGALDALRDGTRFDLILCDIMMPEMNGIELHAELLQLAPDQAARMVFLTGGPGTSLVKDFLESIPNAHIEKPFDTHRLRALVAGHMHDHDALPDLAPAQQ